MGAMCGKYQKTPHGRGAENELLRLFLSECNAVDGYESIGKGSISGAVITRKLRKTDADASTPGNSSSRSRDSSQKNGLIANVESSTRDINGKYDEYTYRGVDYVTGHVNDIYHYFCDTLGGDRFELLEEVDDRRAVFHWLHEFSMHKTVGINRSSNRDGSFVSTISRESRGSRAGSYTSQGSIDGSIMVTAVDEESEVIVDGNGNNNNGYDAHKLSTTSATLSLEVAPISDPVPQETKKLSMRKKERSTRSKKRQKSADATKIELVKKRDFVIYRSVFKLGVARVCIIAESCNHKLAPKVEDDTVRADVNIMGVLIEELEEEERKKMMNYAAIEANAANDPDALINAKRQLREPISRVTFLISINPHFAPEELIRLPESDISFLLGEARVREIVEGVKSYFESKENKIFVKFRALAAAPIGEMGWIAQEKSKTDLQLGTNVKHPVYGHGIVRAFDMKGKIHVAYDNGEIVRHEPNEKDSLHVAVQIGTRVVHPTRGAGTVKQFDETGRIHVKFDNNEYHRYKQAAWKKKMHEYKLLGTGGALETITISYRDFEESREKQGRVKFAVGVSTREVLEYLLDYQEDEKTGNILKNEIIEEKNPFHRIRYQQRKMPPPLTDRDFVYEEIWREVAPLTYVIVNKSVEHEAKKSVSAGVVRGMILLSGYLIEPLFTEDGKDHIAQITHMLCIDPQGFVPPDAVAGIRTGQLLGAVTDMRAHFWRRTQEKKSVQVVNRKLTSTRSAGPNSLRLSKSQANSKSKLKIV